MLDYIKMFDFELLNKVDDWLSYNVAFPERQIGVNVVEDRIDEEGCGAVMAAVALEVNVYD